MPGPLAMFGKIELLAERLGLDAIVLTAPDNISYVTGIDVVGDFVGVIAYVRKGGWKAFVPLLEYYRFRNSLPGDVEVVALSKTLKPPDAVVTDKDWRAIIAEIASGAEKVGADLSHSSGLQLTVREAGGSKLVDISNDVWKARAIKTPAEIEAHKKAIEITAKGIRALVDNITESSTESQLAGIFEARTRLEGVEKFAFEPIIAFKPSNSYPHTLPSARKIGARGDLVLIDVGVKYRGRCSDLTRMVIVGRPGKDERIALEAVEEALLEAIDSIKPGVKAGEVFEAAAKVLERYGLREKFIHGLGHGLGVVVHEPPYIRQGSDAVIEPNMLFTIEPGVYFNNKYGVRLEEDVLVTKKGAKVLSGELERVFSITL